MRSLKAQARGQVGSTTHHSRGSSCPQHGTPAHVAPTSHGRDELIPLYAWSNPSSDRGAMHCCSLSHGSHQSLNVTGRI